MYLLCINIQDTSYLHMGLILNKLPLRILIAKPRQVSTSSSCGTKPPCRNAPNNVPPLWSELRNGWVVFGTKKQGPLPEIYQGNCNFLE